MSWLETIEKTNVVAHAVLVLCVVSIAGFAIAAIKIRGIGLGSAGVLFAGLLFGHFGWHIQHEVLDFAREFGLILFVFTIGLQIGPGFFASLQRQGLALNICAAAIVIGGAAPGGSYGSASRQQLFRGGWIVFRSHHQHSFAWGCAGGDLGRTVRDERG